MYITAYIFTIHTVSIAIKLFNSAGKLARTEKLWQEKLINVRMYFYGTQGHPFHGV